MQNLKVPAEKRRNMASAFRKISQFVMYWYLTYIFGTLCFAYYLLCRLLGRVKDKEEKEKRMQPLCLSHPVYGSHKYFKHRGVKIHYVESGDKNAQVVVLIHGIPGFWFCWRKQIPELAQFFRVIALDLRGCGDSESPNQRENYSKNVQIEDIICLIDSLGCYSAHVICCETSGYLGWELALRYPDLVSKLVLINAPHPSVLHHLFHIKPFYYFKYWYLLFLQIPLLPETVTSQDQTNGWLNSLLDPAVKFKVITDEEIEAYKYTFSRKADWRGTINNLRQIDLRPWIDKCHLSVISTSALILIGSSHPYLTVEAAYRSAELAERIKVRVIQNAGSNLQVTHSKRTNEELVEFLVDHRSAPSPNSERKSSLVQRVFGAVTSPYATVNGDVVSISNGIREAAQNTLTSGVNLAQTVWPRGYKSTNSKMSQIVC